MRRALTLAALLVFAASAAAPAPAGADTERPSTRNLVLAGLAMAPPTYFLGVVAHEGSHALAGKLFGAKVVEFHVIPGRYGPEKNFHFGYVRVAGPLTPRQRTIFWLAPKITDAVALGGYSIAYATGALPRNRYGQLALAVLATGFWVDFSKDIISYWDSNDLVKAYNQNGLDSEPKRLPFRLLHAGLSAGAGYVIFRGYQQVFADSPDPEAPALLVPLWLGTF